MKIKSSDKKEPTEAAPSVRKVTPFKLNNTSVCKTLTSPKINLVSKKTNYILIKNKAEGIYPPPVGYCYEIESTTDMIFLISFCGFFHQFVLQIRCILQPRDSRYFCL